MKETTRLATPDSVELEFRLAGPGSRFLALFLDGLISIVLYGAILVAAIALGAFAGNEPVSTAATVLLSVGLFVVRWGYFLFFEIRFRGQTPGKRVLGIRVVREGGLPLGVSHSLIRNLLRFVDGFPQPFCVVGAASVLATRKGQRLGDLAAGTIVIRERFRPARERAAGTEQSAGWVSRIEQGRSRTAVLLPRGQVTIAQVALIEEYFRRSGELGPAQRGALSWRIALPLLLLFDRKTEDWEGAANRLVLCESLLQEVLDLSRHGAEAGQAPVAPAPAAQTAAAEDSPAVEAKARAWERFAVLTDRLLRRGRRAARKLSPQELREILVGYRGITTDLARAQSMGADPGTVQRLNRLAIGGHVLIYGHARPARRERGWRLIWSFPRAVRENIWAVALSALLVFGPAVISGIAVQVDPSVAYDLVGPDFYDFQPASGSSIHSFPQLMRPVVASQVLTNNLQVAILAFAFGLTAGVGTAFLLVTNGMHLGAVTGWLGMHGHAGSLWGWVMPHGGTEILAIIISGAAGFLLARALLFPGRLKRAAALKRNAGRALVLELGCMAMLVVAGLIEGFVSPSSLLLAPQLVFAGVMIVLWALFFSLGGSYIGRAGAVPARRSDGVQRAVRGPGPDVGLRMGQPEERLEEAARGAGSPQDPQ